MTLVIYDDSGVIFSRMSGDYLVPQGGVQYLEVEVPTGKLVTGIDVSTVPHKAILGDIPKTEVQLLQAQVDSLNIAMAEILGV